ncbi:hypothetical protein Lesp02_03760 [Lentzea sp. NBRC 105346]|nr:hypothetical protein Lesp02_03760 [Lentzea sp. NBRC 105346]
MWRGGILCRDGVSGRANSAAWSFTPQMRRDVLIAAFPLMMWVGQVQHRMAGPSAATVGAAARILSGGADEYAADVRAGSERDSLRRKSGPHLATADAQTGS